jgi:hypothetical protein
MLQWRLLKPRCCCCCLTLLLLLLLLLGVCIICLCLHVGIVTLPKPQRRFLVL